MSDGLIGELNDSVDEFDEALEDCHLECYSVDKTGDRTCEITVDFGMCHPSAVMRLVKAICMDVAGIKTINRLSVTTTFPAAVHGAIRL